MHCVLINAFQQKKMFAFHNNMQRSSLHFGDERAIVKERHGKSMCFMYKNPGAPSHSNFAGWVKKGTEVEVIGNTKWNDDVFAHIVHEGQKVYIKKGNLVMNATNVKVVSYNLSFAAALEVATGSEEKFVEKYCLNKDEGHCRQNAMQSIQKMVVKPSTVCFQEYIPWALRKKSMLGLPFEYVSFDIQGSDMISPSLQMKDLFRSSAHVEGLWVAMHGSFFYEGIANVWDTNVMGVMVNNACVNLASDGHGVRPCLMTMMSTGVLIINCHAPQPHGWTKASFISKVESGISSMQHTMKHTIKSILLCGDFNDRKWEFRDGVILSGIKVNAPELIKTCCYNPGGGSGWNSGIYKFNGDYIMSSEPVMNPRIFNIDGKWQKTPAEQPSLMEGRSDHEPITAEVLLSL